MSEPAPTPASEKSSQGGLPRRGWLLVVPIAAGLLILLIAALLVVFLGLRNVLTKEEAHPGMSVEVTKLPTTISTSPLAPPSCETIVGSGDVQVAVPLPISMTVGSETFPVVAMVLEGGEWSYPPDRSRAAVWVCGTVVNYVVGMEPTAENQALLAGLDPGDELQLRLSSGVTLLFRFAERREVPANQGSVFGQVRPRLTLILESAEDTWQVATADYVAETEPVERPSGTLVQPGQPVRVGDAQVTVTRGHVERSGPDLATGMMYYLVEFSVENSGITPLDSTAFDMRLQDGAGNVYLFSPAASAAGEHGSLSEEIRPGTTVQGTAGYLVPETMAGPSLIWTFSPWPGSESQASVSIPYQGETEPGLVGRSEVTITDAFLDDGDDVLVIEGEVRNTGGQPLTVELSDLSLTSSAGISDLRMAAPPLPWTIEAGQSQVIELQYTKPQASAALLTLLGYSFEIQGLQ